MNARRMASPRSALDGLLHTLTTSDVVRDVSRRHSSRAAASRPSVSPRSSCREEPQDPEQRLQRLQEPSAPSLRVAAGREIRRGGRSAGMTCAR